MEVFAETTGVSADLIKQFMAWFLSFCIVLFGVVVLRGTYERWIDGDVQVTEVIVDVVIAMAVIVYVGILVR